MKRLFLIFVLGMPIVANFAGNIGKRSDRKIIEISKIIKHFINARECYT